MVHPTFSLARFAPTLATLYLAVLISVLLYPFEFSSRDTSLENNFEWRTDAAGIQFGVSGMLHSASPPVSLYRRLISGEGLTIEVWLSSANANQGGPARIVSYSLNPWERNFTLGQDGDDLIMRLRTTRTDENATSPSLNVPNVFVPETMQHIVVTYDYLEQRVYVDGKLRVAAMIPQGTFETWDPSYFLVFGNEFGGERPWSGTIAYAAIYGLPLPERDIVAKYDAGLGFGDAPRAAGLILAFDFTQGLESLKNRANTVQTVSQMLPLKKPVRVPRDSRTFFSFMIDAEGKMTIPRRPTVWDFIRNVVLFVPFGAFVFAWLERRVQSTALAILITAVGVSLVSATLEALQFILASRSSSIFDFGANVIGAIAGAAGCWYWFLQGGELQRTRKPTP